MKPNVFIAGFPRCGSTYLTKILEQHNKVKIIKDLCYFNYTNKFLAPQNVLNDRYIKSFSGYINSFGRRRTRVDCSILTSYDKDSAKRIKEELGDIKIIFLLRSKEDFRESLHTIMVQTGEIWNISFEKYAKKYAHLDFYYSSFDEHIERFKKLFSNVMVFNLVDNDTEKEIKKILKFLNLPDYDFNYDVYRNTRDERRPADFFQPLKRELLIHYPRIHSVLRRVKEYMLVKRHEGGKRT